MKLTDSKIEGIGLILLLISFGWQTFQEDLNDMAKKQQDYQMHEKLDHIWHLLTDLYTHSDTNMSPDNPMTKYNIKAGLENWKLYGNILAERKNIESQAQFFFLIQIILYVIGSICVIVPKFRKQNN